MSEAAFHLPCLFVFFGKFPRQEENSEPEPSALRRSRVRFHHMDTVKMKTFELIRHNKIQGRRVSDEINATLTKTVPSFPRVQTAIPA